MRESADLAAAIASALQYDDKVLAETYIPGRELTVGIVDGEVLPVVEVRAQGNWYSYDAKYLTGDTEYCVPAPISAACAALCEDYSRKAYDAVGCRGMARVDFRVPDDASIYCLEVNTIPGFTESSLLPKAAAEAGMAFHELCDRIMRTATC